MKKGQKVKTEILNGVYFTGIYRDDLPGGKNILIDNGKMGLIATKDNCTSVENIKIKEE